MIFEINVTAKKKKDQKETRNTNVLFHRNNTHTDLR